MAQEKINLHTLGVNDGPLLRTGLGKETELHVASALYSLRRSAQAAPICTLLTIYCHCVYHPLHVAQYAA